MERHTVIALSLVALVVPSMVLSAPAILDQLMDIDGADQQEEAFAAAVHDLERRESDLREGAQGLGPLEQQVRARRSSTRMDECIMNCWLCIKSMMRYSIKLGDCITGCSGRTKTLTNPLEAQSWSRCRSNFVQS